MYLIFISISVVLMIIRENDIRKMVSETARRILSEISVRDAYQRFYQDNVPEKVYSALMKGTDLMTPFHKLMLDTYTKGDATDEDLANAGNLWSNASNEARQYLVNAAKDDKEYYSENAWRVRSLIKKVGSMKSHTENSFNQRGLEVLYKDENVMVTCTKSYTASHKAYGDSHWCTASDIFGNYNGFEMYVRYTMDDGNNILVQFIDLTNKENNSYQVQYGVWRGSADEEEICNWYDKQCEIGSVIAMLKSHGVDYQQIKSEYIDKNAARLVEETRDNIADESDYYTRKRRVRERKVFKEIKKKYNSQDFRTKALAAIRDSMSKRHQVSFGEGVSYVEKVMNILSLNGNNSGEITYVATVEYSGYDDGEQELINQLMDEDYYSALTQTWLVNKDFNIIAIHQGCYGGCKDNIIRLKTEPQWGNDIALVNAVNGKVVASYFNDIEMKRVDHIIEVYDHSEDGWLMSSITGEKIPGRPRN